MATQFFGQFLLSRGLITRSQLLEAVEYQEKNNLRLGEYAVKKGVISLAESTKILAAQAKRDVQFGEAAVELGILDDQKLQQLLRAQRADHVFLNDVLVRLNVLSAEASHTLMKSYRDDQRGQNGESIFVPPDVPHVAFVAEACDLTRRMFLRSWATPTKYGIVRSKITSVTFEGTAVEVPVTGDICARYCIGIPNPLVISVIRRLFGTETPSDEERHDMVAELANVIVGNLVAGLTNVGHEVTLGPPIAVPANLPLNNELAVVMPLITPTCEPLIAVTYAADGKPGSR